MIRDILHFNRTALDASGEDGLNRGRGCWNKLGHRALVPRTITLAPLVRRDLVDALEKILDFPAHAMMTFFENRALLGVTNRPSTNGTRSAAGRAEYVARLGRANGRARGVVMPSWACPVDSVAPATAAGPEDQGGGPPIGRISNAVVLATH